MIRHLRQDEPIPTGTPARYVSGHGYVRLRWHVGPDLYVEDYEHRVVMGRPEGLHVHHRNQDRADNRPINLQLLTPREHADLHEALQCAYNPQRGLRFDGYRSQSAMEKAHRARARREALTARTGRMAALYRQGWSTTEVGLVFGIDSSNVSIHLRRYGVDMRPFAKTTRRRAA